LVPQSCTSKTGSQQKQSAWQSKAGLVRKFLAAPATRRRLKIFYRSIPEILAPLTGSWFDQTYQHFCSHRQTPSSGSVSQPLIVQNGRCIYFSNPIFSQYDDNAPHWCKVLVLDAIGRLLADPLVKHGGPSTLQVTVTHQSDYNRWVVHLLHFIPERRSKELDM
jgi:hypothetical protein